VLHQLGFQIRNFFIARIHLLSRNFWLYRLNFIVLFRDNFFRGLPSGVFCSLLLMNFSAFFCIHLANFAYYGDQFPGFKGTRQIVIIH
jgi:NAD+ kinase